MAFVAEMKNVMLVSTSKIKGGEYQLFTFVEMDKFNKVTMLGDKEIVEFEPKTMVDVRFSVSQSPITVVKGEKTVNATETKAFIVGIQPATK